MKQAESEAVPERHIGQVIRAARKERTGLSQEGLARAAEISFNALTRLERGEIRDPHFSTISRICDVLGLSVDSLRGEEDPKVQAPTSLLSTRDEERRIIEQWAYFSDPKNAAESKALAAEIERVGGEDEGWAADTLRTVLRPPIREEVSAKRSSEVTASER